MVEISIAYNGALLHISSHSTVMVRSFKIGRLYKSGFSQSQVLNIYQHTYKAERREGERRERGREKDRRGRERKGRKEERKG